ncbi:MAG: protein kinase [Methanomicrobiales archaeon]
MTRIFPATRLIVVFLLIACITCIATTAAAEHTVAPSGAEFTGINAAIQWASPGDTITVESGTYLESVHLDKKLSLIGIDSGNGTPVIDPDKKGNGMEIRVDGCTVEGFVIRNSDLLNGIFITSDLNTIRKNTIVNNAQGIKLVSAQDNILSGNNISNNQRTGIVLEGSTGNLIEGNSIRTNNHGISLDASSLSNRLSRNNFLNTQNVLSKSATSVWSTTTPLTYTYLGKTEESPMGNYWSDYLGRDKNGDGIGDTPYMIAIGGNPKAILESDQNIVDQFPLMDPMEYYTGIMPVPVKALPLTPTPLIPFPTVSLGPATTATTATTANATLTVPVTSALTQSPVSAENPRDSLPSGTITFVMGLIIFAVLAGGIVMVYRWQQARVTPAIAGEPTEIPPAKPVVISRRTRSPLTTPGTETSLSDDSMDDSFHDDYYPALSDQKYYFPRELENKYTDIAFIGRGGIAWVFSAIRKTDGLKVAVKIPISFDEMTGKSFLNEIKAWETLRHENIVEVFGVNILPVPYVEMEFVPASLEEQEKPLPVWKAVHIIKGIADGLSYAHVHGFIHRDIKPHNILLNDDCVPKITDWGMSKVLAADVKKSSIAGFSLSYAAPEQVSPSEFGRTDERTDVYQLGVVFYELVTGSIPFGGESIVEVGNAILREAPLPPSEYNTDAAAVEKIIGKCLEKNPADRYQSAAELLDALSRYLDEDDE